MMGKPELALLSILLALAGPAAAKADAADASRDITVRRAGGDETAKEEAFAAALAGLGDVREATLTDLAKKSPLTTSVMRFEQPPFARPLPRPERRSYGGGHDDRRKGQHKEHKGQHGAHEVDSSCGVCHTDLELGEEGLVRSPGFARHMGGHYPANVSCLWLLQTADPAHRIRLACDTVDLEPCGPLGRGSPDWNDLLVISPHWTFSRSWVYCGQISAGHAEGTRLVHTTACDRIAVAFKANDNHGRYRGFSCTYRVIE